VIIFTVTDDKFFVLCTGSPFTSVLTSNNFTFWEDVYRFNIFKIKCARKVCWLQRNELVYWIRKKRNPSLEQQKSSMLRRNFGWKTRNLSKLFVINCSFFLQGNIFDFKRKQCRFQGSSSLFRSVFVYIKLQVTLSEFEPYNISIRQKIFR